MFNFRKKDIIFSHLFVAIWESEAKSHKSHLYALLWFKLGPDPELKNTDCVLNHVCYEWASLPEKKNIAKRTPHREI